MKRKEWQAGETAYRCVYGSSPHKLRIQKVRITQVYGDGGVNYTDPKGGLWFCPPEDAPKLCRFRETLVRILRMLSRGDT